jgi:hypothetical protein
LLFFSASAKQNALICKRGKKLSKIDFFFSIFFVFCSLVEVDFDGWLKKVPLARFAKVVKFDTLSLPSYHYAYKWGNWNSSNVNWSTDISSIYFKVKYYHFECPIESVRQYGISRLTTFEILKDKTKLYLIDGFSLSNSKFILQTLRLTLPEKIKSLENPAIDF